MLIKSFVKCHPPPLPNTPLRGQTTEWDTSLVLCSLTQHPYKPFRTGLDKDLTLKVLFLLPLALAKRKVCT